MDDSEYRPMQFRMGTPSLAAKSIRSRIQQGALGTDRKRRGGTEEPSRGDKSRPLAGDHEELA